MTRYIIIKDCREGKAGETVKLPFRRAVALVKSGHVRLLDWKETAVQKHG